LKTGFSEAPETPGLLRAAAGAYAFSDWKAAFHTPELAPGYLRSAGGCFYRWLDKFAKGYNTLIVEAVPKLQFLEQPLAQGENCKSRKCLTYKELAIFS
jgi:hypothetical protein